MENTTFTFRTEKNYENTYPKNFFNLIGSGKDLDIEETKELSFNKDKRETL